MGLRSIPSVVCINLQNNLHYFVSLDKKYPFKSGSILPDSINHPYH